MYLRKFVKNKMITVDYDMNGTIQTLTGQVYWINLKEQLLSLKDEKQKIVTIKLSGIRNIY
jgi:hypothetical protein